MPLSPTVYVTLGVTPVHHSSLSDPCKWRCRDSGFKFQTGQGVLDLNFKLGGLGFKFGCILDSDFYTSWIQISNPFQTGWDSGFKLDTAVLPWPKPKLGLFKLIAITPWGATWTAPTQLNHY